MSGKNQLVVPKSKGWAVRSEGSKKITKGFDTKAEAVASARSIAKNQGSELVIHNKNGRIAQKDSHGHDPFPPRG